MIRISFLQAMNRTLLVLSIAISVAANGQTRRVELFASAGVGRVAGDEGSLGTGVAAGGTVTIPFAARWAVDVDVTHIRAERSVGQGFQLYGRHTHLSPAIQYRRGDERVYGFVSFGPGLTYSSEGSNFSGRQFLVNDTGFQWHAKAGVVGRLSGRLLVRADFFTNFRYVLPDMGARIGIGWRL